MTSRQTSILAVTILTQGTAVGLSYGVFPVFLEPLEQAFDAPRTQVSSGLIVLMFSLAIGSTFTGIAFDRGHARLPMLLGALCFAGALLVASVAPSLPVMALAAVMAGFAIPSVGPLAGASLLSRYFAEDRGRALGLMSIGAPLGSGLFAWVAGWLLLSIDWREAFLVFAGVSLLVMLPIILFIVPGQLPPDPAPSPQVEEMEDDSGGMGAIARNPVFWWSAVLFALLVGISQGWTAHVAAYLGGLGIDEVGRSRLVALQYWMGVPGALFFGVMADRVGLTSLFLLMLLTAAGGFAIFAFEPLPIIAALLCGAFGFVFGGAIPLYMMLIGERMGAEALGRAMGLSNLVMLPVTAASVLIAATVYESTGHYSLALLGFCGGMLVAVGCLFGSNRSHQTT